MADWPKCDCAGPSRFHYDDCAFARAVNRPGTGCATFTMPRGALAEILRDLEDYQSDTEPKASVRIEAIEAYDPKLRPDGES